MRRIKSAPANLSIMCNKKREKNINCKASIMITNTVKNKEQFYLIKDIKEIKTKKQIINTSSNIITDIFSPSKLIFSFRN